LVRDDCEPREVKSIVDILCFDDDASGRIGFSNTWIMLKDWANQNRHEVVHRYFASVAEICQWAHGYFGEPKSVKVNHYRLNALIFNELGIGHVLDHIEREAASESSGGPFAIVERDESHLAEWLWNNDRLNVLVDFARGQFKKNPDLAKALDAREESVSVDTWKEIDPALAPLARPNTAPAFNLPCSVLVFEKGRARTS
jgi:hypothetical protein